MKRKMLLERTNCGIEELNHDLEKINSNRMYVKLTTDADENRNMHRKCSG